MIVTLLTVISHTYISPSSFLHVNSQGLKYTSTHTHDKQLNREYINTNTNNDNNETTKEHLPIVLWHGMGDNCCHDFSMGAFKSTLEFKLQNKVYVKSLMVGDSPDADTKNGFFMNVNDQIDMVCVCRLIQN